MYANTVISPAVWDRPLKEQLDFYLTALRAYHRARRDQILLSHMSDHLLSDMGLSRDDVRYLKPAPFGPSDK